LSLVKNRLEKLDPDKLNEKEKLAQELFLKDFDKRDQDPRSWGRD